MTTTMIITEKNIIQHQRLETFKGTKQNISLRTTKHLWWWDK